MYFPDRILRWLRYISDDLYEAYLEVKGWVFPFYYLSSPLYWLYVDFDQLVSYFDDFFWWVRYANQEIGTILSYSEISSYLEPYFTAIEAAYLWVLGSFWNVWDVIDSWWSVKKWDILAWVDEAVAGVRTLVDQTNVWLATLQSAWDNFKGMIPTLDQVIYWWRNWTGNVTAMVNTWWTSTLLEVQSLINTAFIEREPFWAGWQDWRGKVTEFFTDPEDWLYKAADRIIERFW